ncbi:hypothetical protein [Paludibacterium denitrificans]|uniref:hypothetical protein n=1 Tax=Paludibacterium denitrificans TaxID=2675226 RepID=UPI002477D098|nr:hypothetical protein [Paludibacterium denitrificans]
MNALAPIPLGKTGKPWAVLIQVPKKVVLAQVNELNHDITTRSVFTTMLQVGIGASASSYWPACSCGGCRPGLPNRSAKLLILHKISNTEFLTRALP